MPKRRDPAMVVPVFIQASHLLDFLHPSVTDERSLKRWWKDAHALQMTNGQVYMPDFIELQIARRMLHAVRLIHLRRAATRREALEQALASPLDLLPLITGVNVAASKDIDQILYDLVTQQIAFLKLEGRVDKLERVQVQSSNARTDRAVAQ